MQDARVIHQFEMPSPPTTLTLPTDLTVARVQESFASPDTLSFWDLPGFIALLDRSGFSSIRHRLHFQALLALPLLAATMALVSAGFSMRPARRGGVAQMIGSGVAAGFALFVVSKVAEEFGQSGALPVGTCCLGAGRRRTDAVHRIAAPHGRRLSMPRPQTAARAFLRGLLVALLLAVLSVGAHAQLSSLASTSGTNHRSHATSR